MPASRILAQKARVADTQCMSGFTPVPMVCLQSLSNDRLLELFGRGTYNFF